MLPHQIDEYLPEGDTPDLAGVVDLVVRTPRDRTLRRTDRQYGTGTDVPEGQRVLLHVHGVGVSPDGEVVVVVEPGHQVRPATHGEGAVEVIRALGGHTDREEVPPAFPHGPSLLVGQPGRIADQAVGDVVTHLMKRDQRFMIAGPAGKAGG